LEHYPEVVRRGEEDLPEIVYEQQPGIEAVPSPSDGEKKYPWKTQWRKKRVVVIVVGLLIAITALGVVLGILLRKRGGTSPM
jgi:hypothetical protein